MRKLTVHRLFSLFGFMNRDAIYHSDEVFGTHVVNGIKCTYLGELTNGREVSFKIPTDNVKIFIAEKGSGLKNVEFYELQQGIEPEIIFCKHVFNPAYGHPVTICSSKDKVIHSYRIKKTIIGIFALLLAVIIGIFIGLIPRLGKSADSKSVVFNGAGYSVVLDSCFTQANDTYSSDHCFITVSAESFETFDNLGYKRLDKKGYAEALLSGINIQTEIKETNDLTYFEYNVTKSGTEVHYTVFVYLTGDAYYSISFCVYSFEYSLYKDQIFVWAKQFKFD